MVQDLSIATSLLLSIWCLFVRRGTWRCSARRALTLSVAFTAVGVLLTAPFLTVLDHSVLINSIGVQHVDDYLGHVCFFVALGSVCYALLLREVPDRVATRLLLHRVVYPGTAAAVLMIAMMTQSQHLRSRGPWERNDFFDVPCGMFLHAYWTIYVSMLIYLLGYMFRLLLVLRHDPRSRTTANLYLLASVLGIIATLAEYADTWNHFLDGWLWLLLVAPAVGLSLAAGTSWRRELREERSGLAQRRPHACEGPDTAVPT